MAAQAVQQPHLLGRSNPTPRVVPPDTIATTASPKMSEEATMLAAKIGLLPKLKRLEELRATAPNSEEEMALRQDVVENIMMAGYEVRAVAARIDRELANASEVLAFLAERRDRAVRLNSYADFISGGITGMISSGMKIGDAGGVAPDIIDSVEGAFQTGLATWALHEQRGEKRREQGVPSILTHLFQTKSAAQADYPPTVWTYLSSPIPASKTSASRLDIVVDRWLKVGVCFTHPRGHRHDTRTRIQHISNAETAPRVTIDILEDRIAMLNDLRATVVQMDEDLLEFTQCLQGLRRTSPAN
jgi:hypothetical protein